MIYNENAAGLFPRHPSRRKFRERMYIQMSKKTIEDVNVQGKKVIVRVDFNVPMDKETGTKITDENRIIGALPTIQYLLKNGAALILCSHMGKPHNVLNDKLKLNKKEKAKIEALPAEEQAEATAKALEKAAKDIKKLSLAPVAARLSELLGQEVIMAKDVIGEDAKAKAAALKPGEVMLLENLRFHAEEEKNDPAFAKALADMAELYVNDAFGTAHRAHASTAGVADYLPAVSGYLIEKELKFMGGALENPGRPFVAILGGAKVSTKIGVITNLIDKVDALIIGGGMAYTFSKAQGGEIGASLLEEDKVELAKEIMDKQYSVRETEEQIRRIQREAEEPAPEKQKTSPLRMYYKEAERQLTTRLSRKVTISPGKKKGKIALEYYDQDDLNALMKALEALAPGREAGN